MAELTYEPKRQDLINRYRDDALKFEPRSQRKSICHRHPSRVTF